MIGIILINSEDMDDTLDFTMSLECDPKDRGRVGEGASVVIEVIPIRVGDPSASVVDTGLPRVVEIPIGTDSEWVAVVGVVGDADPTGSLDIQLV